MTPTEISHYRIMGELGHGGMASVYKAIDTTTGNPVALKVLLPHLATDETVQRRFLREGNTGLRLNHPGIAKVFKVGEEHDRPFIAMELVEGQSLDRAICVCGQEGNVDRIIEIGIEVADALIAAHAMGIIHRDIKPGNILIDRDAAVKIMDFGLAQILDTSSLTGIHEIVGTLSYMSPQQAIGDEIDHRSDIFSLGVVLYQLLTGSLPFAGSHPGAIIHSILHSDPMRMTERKDGVPVELERVVFKALQKDPQDRYQSALDLKSDLEKVRDRADGAVCPLIATEVVFEEQSRGIYSIFIGHEEEMAVMERAFEKMLGGESSTIILRGEAGIGKTRIAFELGRTARRRDTRYITGICLPGKGCYPYKPIIDVILSFLEAKNVKESRELPQFIEDNAPHLSARLNLIRTFLLMNPDDESTAPNQEQIRDTACELVKMMARDRPVLIHIDDLHHADEPTLKLFHYIARNTRTDRIMFVCTVRSEELAGKHDGKPHPLLETMERMKEESVSREIELCRLNSSESEDLMRAVFDNATFPRAFIDSLFLDTDGNPLFIIEALKLLRHEGIISREKTGGWRLSGDYRSVAIPPLIRDVIVNRLGKLSSRERRVLEAASVEGQLFHADTLRHSLGLRRLRLLQILQDLEQVHHLIHASSREYHFDHCTIREVVYDNLIPELREEYHRCIGEYLIEHFDEEEEYAGHIAHHLIGASREKDSLPYLLRAGKRDKRLFVNEKATEYFDRGLEILNTFDRKIPRKRVRSLRLSFLEERAGVKELIARYDDALADYRMMRRLAARSNDRRKLACSLNGMGRTSARKDERGKALRYFENALTIQEEIGDRRGKCDTLTEIGSIYRDHGESGTALEFLKRALTLCREIRNRKGEGYVLHTMGSICIQRGDLKPALGYCEQALKIRKRTGDRRGEGDTLNNIGIIYKDMGDHRKALIFSRRSLKIHRQIGNKRIEGASLHNMGTSFKERGKYGKALVFFEQALEIWRQIGERGVESLTLATLGNLLMNRGDYDRALPYYELALKIQRQTGDRHNESWTLSSMGNYHYHRGEFDEALLHYEEALQIERDVGDRMGEGMTLNNIGHIYADLADYEAALECFKGALKIQQETGAETDVGMNLFCIGEVHLYRGEYETASEYYERTLKIWNKTGFRKGTGNAWNALGNVHDALGDYEASLDCFTRARKIIRSLGDRDTQWESERYLARLWANMGDSTKAKKHLEEGATLARKLGTPKTDIWFHLDTGRLKYMQGDIDGARYRIRRGLEKARELKLVDAILEGLSASIKCDIATEDMTGAMERATEILGLSTEKGRKYEMAEANLCLARIHLHSRNFDRAISHAKEGIGISRSCRMKELLVQAHHCLGRTYAMMNRNRASDREYRLAEAITGEIASQLHSSHRSRYLSKTGIENLRRESTCREQI